jgi:hypothetical protein
MIPYIHTAIAMHFAVSLMRFRGRPLPRVELANRAALIGDLTIGEQREGDLGRHLRVARVVATDAHGAPLLLGELLEPGLVAMSPQAFTLAGFERADGRWYAQSWLVRCASHATQAIGVVAAFRPVVRIDVPNR